MSARRFQRPSPPWWLVPNLLSLDAPLVAVVWLGLFSAAFGIAVPGVEYLLLGMAVWVVYVLDRLADARFLRDADGATPRHRFYARHGRVFAAAALAAGGGGLALAVLHLEKPVLLAGLVLAAAAAAYQAAILLARTGKRPRYFGKEWLIGTIFAAGTCLPVLLRAAGDQRPRLAGAAGLFGLLCALNCIGIACWEREQDARDDPNAVTRHWPGIDRAYAVMIFAYGALLFVAASIVFPDPACAVFLELRGSMGMGAAILLWLHFLRNRLSSDALRTLADAALFFPPLVALLLRWAIIAPSPQ